MEEKSNWFLGLLTAFRSAPAHFLILLFSLVCAYMVYQQHEAITKWLVPNPSEESNYFSNSIDRDILINDALLEFTLTHSASGAFIEQYHNGQYDLTNIPFQKVSVTYYQMTDSSNSEDVIFRTRPISTIAHTNRDMWKGPQGPSCVGYEVSQIRDQSHKRRLSSMGYEYVHQCPIENIRNYPIGYVSVGYSFIPGAEIISRLEWDEKRLATRIAGYLQEGVNRND